MKRYQRMVAEGGKGKRSKSEQRPSKSVVCSGQPAGKSAQFAAYSDQRTRPSIVMNHVVALSTGKKFDSLSIRRGLAQLKTSTPRQSDEATVEGILIDLDRELYPDARVTLNSLVRLIKNFASARRPQTNLIFEATGATLKKVKKVLGMPRLPVIKFSGSDEVQCSLISFRAKDSSELEHEKRHTKIIGPGALGKEAYAQLADALKSGHTK